MEKLKIGMYDSFNIDNDIDFIDPINNSKVTIKKGYYQSKDLESCCDWFRINDNLEIEEHIFDYVEVPENERKYKWQITKPIDKGWKKTESFIGSIYIYGGNVDNNNAYVLFVEKGKIFRVIELKKE